MEKTEEDGEEVLLANTVWCGGVYVKCDLSISTDEPLTGGASWLTYGGRRGHVCVPASGEKVMDTCLKRERVITCHVAWDLMPRKAHGPSLTGRAGPQDRLIVGPVISAHISRGAHPTRGGRRRHAPPSPPPRRRRRLRRLRWNPRRGPVTPHPLRLAFSASGYFRSEKAADPPRAGRITRPHRWYQGRRDLHLPNSILSMSWRRLELAALCAYALGFYLVVIRKSLRLSHGIQSSQIPKSSIAVNFGTASHHIIAWFVQITLGGCTAYEQAHSLAIWTCVKFLPFLCQCSSFIWRLRSYASDFLAFCRCRTCPMHNGEISGGTYLFLPLWWVHFWCWRICFATATAWREEGPLWCGFSCLSPIYAIYMVLGRKLTNAFRLFFSNICKVSDISISMAVLVSFS